MATQIISTTVLVSNDQGEPLLWLEALDNGTTTINDTGMGVVLTADELTKLGREVRQWLEVTGGVEEGGYTVHIDMSDEN